ncbi:MAG: CoA transferase subunit A [Deltaproteobacteria bacterium]|nr:CoA transferase subunit A [Deltaproteobacteria bacterium]
MTQKLKQGKNRLFTDPDANRAREFFRTKSRSLTNKVTTVKKAVSTYIHDGDYLGIGGFGANRISTALLHEIVRQRKKDLGFAGHTATHDGQILCAGECVNRCDVAYIIGLEARGLSPNSRRAFQSGRIEVTEWTNAALSWRLKAAAMGLSFLPARNILGTDTFEYSAAKEIECPFTGQKYVAYPALYPDVSIIHVHRCDVFGNCQIEGILISDPDLALASKRVIITTEEIIPTEEIRRRPEATVIPYFAVDAVCEVPYGSYPGNMPNLYFSDEGHIQEWLKIERDPEEFKAFIDKYIYNTTDFNEYLQLCGGLEKIMSLRAVERLIK